MVIVYFRCVISTNTCDKDDGTPGSLKIIVFETNTNEPAVFPLPKHCYYLPIFVKANEAIKTAKMIDLPTFYNGVSVL